MKLKPKLKQRKVKSARDVSNYEQVVYEAKPGPCTACMHPTCIVRNRKRTLQSLDRRVQFILKDRACVQDRCTKKGERLPPEEEITLSTIRNREYALDVVTFVGAKRTQKAPLTMLAIRKSLVDDYGVHISERHVTNLYKVFLALLHCVNAQLAPLRRKLEEQGYLILAIDGVSLDDVSSVLYVIRDVVSSEVLFAERVAKQDGAHLAIMLEKVKALGIPIRGVVSDKGTGLVAAVRKALPGVPHQLCQTHFLKNAGRPTEEDLPKLTTVTTTALTGVKELERELQTKSDKLNSTPEEVEFVKELCSAARAGAKTSGDPILGPGPLRRFNRMQDVLKVAQKAKRSKKGKWALLTAFISTLSVLSEQVVLAVRLDKQVAILRRIAHILDSTSKSAQVRRLLSTFLNKLNDAVSSGPADDALSAFIAHVQDKADRYWHGLFACYDVPGLPKSNNALEQMFNIFKRHERKMSGRKSTVGGPVETCAPFVLEAWATLQQRPDICEMFNQVSSEKLAEGMAELELLAGGAKKRRSIQRAPGRHLDAVLKKWLKP